MKIAKLSVEQYKRITGAVVTFDTAKAGVVEIGGRNEQGKSSFLDALEVALAGRKGPKATKPVHRGADRARIVAEFEEEDGSKLVVTRVFYDDGRTTIEVRQDGLKVSKTSEILDRLWSHVAFDPFAWASLPSKEQVDTLVRVSGVDPAPFDKAYAKAFESRTDVNREVNRLAGVLEQLPEAEPDLAEREMVSVASLAADLDALRKRNNERHEAAVAHWAAIDRERELEEQLARVQEDLKEASAARIEADVFAGKLGPAEDGDQIAQQIESAEETNEAIRQQKNRAVIAKEHAELADRSKLLTSQLTETVENKRQAFADADMPVPGLTIEDAEVYLDGTPFSQTSSGGKLRTSVAIAMALNPDLRAIIIRDGSLLDSENRAIIDELAKANDFLVLMEVVDENTPSGIVFEDGALREEVSA